MSILVASNGRVSDEFVLNWKKVLGWRKDPFEPEKSNISYLGGYDLEREKLNLFILNEKKFGTIRGDEGMGKTMLVEWLKSNLEKHKTNFYANLLLADEFSHEKTLINRLSEPLRAEHPIKGKFGRLSVSSITKKSIHKYLADNLKKRYVLIVEDAHLLNKSDFKVLKSISEVPNTSIILSGRKSLKARIAKDELSIELKRLDFHGAKQMLIRRIEDAGGQGTWPFDDKLLKDLYSIVDYNPTKILNVCREKAKELAIEVSQNKIARPQEKKIKEESHHYDWNKLVEHPEVQEKKHKSGFGIKFTIKDDPEFRPAEIKPEVEVEHKLEPVKEEPKKSEQKEEQQKLDHGIVIDFGTQKEEKPIEHKEKNEIVIHLDGHKFQKQASVRARAVHSAQKSRH